MSDFRPEINRLQDKNTKDDLINILADRLEERAKSVNPITEAMFERIAPDTQPIVYARKSENYSENLKPVAKNATALKHLLHEQVGRPRSERVLTLKKQDFAECIVAVDAYDDGHERGPGIHVPTTLPMTAEGFQTEPPTRTIAADSPFEAIVELDEDYHSLLSRWMKNHPDHVDGSCAVYVLDCTPATGDQEDDRIRSLRSTVITKLEHGVKQSELEPTGQAAEALNKDNRIYYVGSTTDLEKRIQEHDTGTAVSGVDFTQVLPPTALVEVQGCESVREARQKEGQRAREINNLENSFAYSDEM
ncbi:GIY-YIG nuclease family protein [Natrialbaceae archaeon A-CW1-1]